jgi:hypothetical protein
VSNKMPKKFHQARWEGEGCAAVNYSKKCSKCREKCSKTRESETIFDDFCRKRSRHYEDENS